MEGASNTAWGMDGEFLILMAGGTTAPVARWRRSAGSGSGNPGS